MCFRIFHKPEGSHTTGLISEFSSLQGALGELEVLSSQGKHRYGRWSVRNTRGELVAKVTISKETEPCQYWSAAQLDSLETAS